MFGKIVLWTMAGYGAVMVLTIVLAAADSELFFAVALFAFTAAWWVIPMLVAAAIIIYKGVHHGKGR